MRDVSPTTTTATAIIVVVTASTIKAQKANFESLVTVSVYSTSYLQLC